MTEYAIRADGLAKSFGLTDAWRYVSLGAPPGSGARPPRPQRRGQDHDRPHPDHAHPAGRLPGRGSRLGRDPGPLCGSGPGSAWPGKSATMDELLTGRQNLDIIGRTYHLGPARSRERAGELLGQFGLTDAAGRMVKTYGAACGGAWTWPPAWWPTRRCCSWTSRPSGLDPVSRTGMWQAIRDLVGPGRHRPAHHAASGRGRPAGRRHRGHQRRGGRRVRNPGPADRAPGQARLRVTLTEAQPARLAGIQAALGRGAPMTAAR